MISQLFATIMMALGVASGTKATSNTFYDAKKPQTKRAATIENVNINETFTIAGNDYSYSRDGNNYLVNKCYIGNNNLPNYNNQYLYINNTLYSMGVQIPSTSRSNVQFFGLFEITNYYNSDLEFELNVYFTAERNYSYDGGLHIYSCPNDMTQYINLTLTSTINTQLTDLYHYARDNGTQLVGNDNLSYNSSYPTDITIESKSGSIILQPQQKITLMYYVYMINKTNTNFINAAPQNFQIYGTAAIPTITYEIVDIPGIIYTVLTMPFSFISTAFNLTVFPGTPYALNFANLFMTLLAVFILLWIIKKVFH